MEHRKVFHFLWRNEMKKELMNQYTLLEAWRLFQVYANVCRDIEDLKDHIKRNIEVLEKEIEKENE